MDGTSVIREATPADAAGFARTQIDAWQAAYKGILPQAYLAAMDVGRMTDGWARRLAGREAGVRWLALCVDGEVVGWSGFGTARDDVGDGVGEVHAINVRPACWSRGLGSLLFSHSVRELAGMRYHHAYLWVAHGNSRALSFYERHGWTADGITKEDDRFTPSLHELRVGSPRLT